MQASTSDVGPDRFQNGRPQGPAVLVTKKRNLASFLGDFSDNTPLYGLLLPGVLAYRGYPISQCQSPAFPLASQLRSGVRVLDIRLAVVDSVLTVYHDIVSQRVTFSAVLDIVFTYLESEEGASETVVMFIKQEDGARTPEWIFSILVKEAVYTADSTRSSRWYLENRIPRLGEVRGKIVMCSRFSDVGAGWPGGDDGLGIRPTTWPDNAKDGFEWYCGSVRVQTHDWYAIPSFLAIPDKFRRCTDILLDKEGDSRDPCSSPPLAPTPTLNISFTSASSFPFALPPMIALGCKWRCLGFTGMNERLGDWIIESLSPSYTGIASANVKIRGWVMIDFVDLPQDLLSLLVECNYH
ncbi:hypothetical protein BS47DRAFT_1286404 [Hydnum rufescens UP504]|uniref:Phosphatidylinositol-specific phospholipase C X domain-containing protein n=1 Tax=Hydnum rufescens UP504 TaxID=1448309 RepID=A0A9P6E2G5_9AGAM|nr:hypothetical protein BS47DRAFT_1286404 [Hydnum rufescens UP504]